LNFDEITKDIARTSASLGKKVKLKETIDKEIEDDKEQLKIYIQELLTKTEVLLLNIDNENRFLVIEECYKKQLLLKKSTILKERHCLRMPFFYKSKINFNAHCLYMKNI